MMLTRAQMDDCISQVVGAGYCAVLFHDGSMAPATTNGSYMLQGAGGVRAIYRPKGKRKPSQDEQDALRSIGREGFTGFTGWNAR